jgi:peptidoglycan/LPS O-acetylase OafA/YrhL
MTSTATPSTDGAAHLPEVRPENARFPALDGLRALAAIAVIGTHVGFNSGRSIAGGWFGSALSRLDIGVAVFFLLSGFLLYRPFVLHVLQGRPLPSIRGFLVRRALRIFPAMWVMTAVTLALITTYVVHPVDWVSYLSLVQVYNHHDYDPNLTHLWTLAVEISFYALLPILAVLVSRGRPDPARAVRRQVVLFALLLVVGVGFDLAQAHHLLTHSQALLWLPAYLDWFCAGMFLALLSCAPDGLGRAASTLRAWASAPGTCFLIAAVVFAISALPIGVPRTLAPATAWQWTLQHELFLVAAFFVMLPLVVGPSGVAHRVLGSRVGHVMGDLSYGIYLWHVPLMIWLQRKAGYEEFRGHFWALFLMTFLASTAFAAISWYGFERRIVRYGARFGRSDPSPTKTAARAATQSS